MTEKTLREYVELLKEKDVLKEAGLGPEQEDRRVKHLSYNSLDVKPGTLFICKGSGFKKEYLDDVIEKGYAVCYLAEEKLTEEIPFILVTDIRKALTAVSEFFYGRTWDRLTMVGLTGTKGKTTTAYFLKSILDAHCAEKGLKPAGLITGVYKFDGEKTEKSNKVTTPEVLELHDHLNRCVENGLSYLVMEASSQGFKYRRTDALRYKVGCFLNLEEDHISANEHTDVEDYFTSKLKIIEQSDIMCVNTEMDPFYRERITAEVKRQGKELLTFGRTGGADDVYGYDIEAGIDSLSLKVKYGGRTEEIRVNIGGFYNADNALAAVTAALALGVSFDSIRGGLSKVKVPGRMEVFTLPDKDVKVVVDYAHNKMSYEALFNSVNIACPERKKLFLFGCCGGKAKNRRKIAGEIADREADKIIITEDDYGNEPFENICADITANISPGKDVEIIKNREEAVRRSLEFSSDGWIVIMTGFSSGNSLRRENGLEPASCDKTSVEKYISEHDGKASFR